MASEFIQSKGIAIYNASFYESRLEESLQAGTWAVDNFLSSMACANEETQKRMIWGTLLHLRNVAFSDDYTTSFLGASYNHIFSNPFTLELYVQTDGCHRLAGLCFEELSGR